MRVRGCAPCDVLHALRGGPGSWHALLQRTSLRCVLPTSCQGLSKCWWYWNRAGSSADSERCMSVTTSTWGRGEGGGWGRTVVRRGGGARTSLAHSGRAAPGRLAAANCRACSPLGSCRCWPTGCHSPAGLPGRLGGRPRAAGRPADESAGGRLLGGGRRWPPLAPAARTLASLSELMRW